MNQKNDNRTGSPTSKSRSGDSIAAVVPVSLSAAESDRLALRPSEVASSLGISERKLWELSADKKIGIPHFRVGRAVLYPIHELKQWISLQVKGGQK